MEYIEGTTLADFIGHKKNLTRRQAAAIVGKLALALPRGRTPRGWSTAT